AGGLVPTETSTSVPALSFVMLGDLDADGNLDMLADDPGNTVPGGGTPMTYRFLGDGHGGFAAAVALGRLEPRALGDLDGDGHPDMVSLSPNSAATVRLGDGAGGFGSPTDYPISAHDTFGFGRAGLADFDGDGHLDLAAAGTEVQCDSG